MHGQLLVNGAAAASFTQADLDNLRVGYHADGDATSSDSFTFQVTDAAGDKTAVATFDVAILASLPPHQSPNIPVTNLYQDVLDRAPEPAGFAYWTATAVAGMPLATMRSDFANSAEAQGDLTRLYNDILSRAPDGGGLAWWTAALADGTSLKDVRAGFAQSPEAQGDVTALYNQILGRAPDPSGFAHWIDALATGTSFATVQMDFAYSGEAKNDLSGLFQSTTGRAPDTAELAGMRDQLLVPGASLSTVQTGAGLAVLPVANGNVSLSSPSGPAEFDFSSVTFGAATIAGFDPARDAIRLKSGAAGGATAGTLPALSSVSGGTAISFDGSHSATLTGVASSSLTAANFDFV